jgi:hypothetical protein
MLYVIYWVVRFHCIILQDHRKRCPRSSISWVDTYVLKFQQLDDLVHTLKTIEGVAPRSTTDSTEQLVWCLIHMWSMLYLISVIYYLMCVCVSTSYHCKLVVGLRTQFWTMLEVWGGLELGCWRLTPNGLYVEDRGISLSGNKTHTSPDKSRVKENTCKWVRVVCYESMRRELQIRPIWVSVWWKTKN